MQGLEQYISQFGKQRDGHIKAAQKKLKGAKADVEKAKQALKAAQQRLNEVLAEAEAAASEASTLAEQIKSAQATIAGTVQTKLMLFIEVKSTAAQTEMCAALAAPAVPCNATQPGRSQIASQKLLHRSSTGSGCPTDMHASGSGGEVSEAARVGQGCSRAGADDG